MGGGKYWLSTAYMNGDGGGDNRNPSQPGGVFIWSRVGEGGDMIITNFRLIENLWTRKQIKKNFVGA